MSTLSLYQTKTKLCIGMDAQSATIDRPGKKYKDLAFIEKRTIIDPSQYDIGNIYDGPGCIAQLVEQLTLNQWVQGSSPCAPTKKI